MNDVPGHVSVVAALETTTSPAMFCFRSISVRKREMTKRHGCCFCSASRSAAAEKSSRVCSRRSAQCRTCAPIRHQGRDIQWIDDGSTAEDYSQRPMLTTRPDDQHASKTCPVAVGQKALAIAGHASERPSLHGGLWQPTNPPHTRQRLERPANRFLADPGLTGATIWAECIRNVGRVFPSAAFLLGRRRAAKEGHRDQYTRPVPQLYVAIDSRFIVGNDIGRQFRCLADISERSGARPNWSLLCHASCFQKMRWPGISRPLGRRPQEIGLQALQNETLGQGRVGGDPRKRETDLGGDGGRTAPIGGASARSWLTRPGPLSALFVCAAQGLRCRLFSSFSPRRSPPSITPIALLSW